MIETSRSGNVFNDRKRLIARLDVLARNEDLQQKLLSSNEWDLIVCDEAHRMSASFFGGDVKYTKRYQLGQLLGQVCRHLLLMSATPHNGKEEDFQLFMALLDGDRFEGRFRDGVHYADSADMMRRLAAYTTSLANCLRERLSGTCFLRRSSTESRKTSRPGFSMSWTEPSIRTTCCSSLSAGH